MSIAYNQYLEATKDSELYRINHKNNLNFKSLTIKILTPILVLISLYFTWKFFHKNYFHLFSSNNTLSTVTSPQVLAPNIEKNLIVTYDTPINQNKTNINISKETVPLTVTNKSLEEKFLNELRQLK